MAIVIAILVAVTAWYFLKPKEQQPQYITAEVTQGDIENSVLATGVLEATKMVSVGAQVSGQVKKMYVQLGDQPTSPRWKPSISVSKPCMPKMQPRVQN